ncbi:nitroreductase [Metapseudomonas furukawaii]|uniref:nitroreductase n=1 Tax=Metapseudomonas furukawaii TaxID=1149133 RepID=UPI0040458B7B
MHVDAAIRSRKSVRRFQPWTVPRHTIERLLKLASSAPSGGNTQPWLVQVVSGECKRKLCEAILLRAETGGTSEPEYTYYPKQWFEPYLARKREVGYGLYESLGIARRNLAARRAQELRNLEFFEAPVGLLLSVDRRLGAGAFVDLGMFAQTFMLAARARGLHTCAQAVFAGYHGIVREHLALPPEQLLVCGLALGYEVVDAAENVFRSSRAPVGEFTVFHGFSEQSAGVEQIWDQEQG